MDVTRAGLSYESLPAQSLCSSLRLGLGLGLGLELGFGLELGVGLGQGVIKAD